EGREGRGDSAEPRRGDYGLRGGFRRPVRAWTRASGGVRQGEAPGVGPVSQHREPLGDRPVPHAVLTRARDPAYYLTAAASGSPAGIGSPAIALAGCGPED